MRILIVDDERANRLLLRKILKGWGHSTIEAVNGKAAIALFEANPPDLMLIDVVMPVLDGISATNAIREWQQQQQDSIYRPIIFLTSLNESDTLARCLQAGGDDFINKPIREEVIRAKLRAHTRIRNLNQQLSDQNDLLSQWRAAVAHEHRIAQKVFQSALADNIEASANTRYYVSPAANFNGDLLMIATSPIGSLYCLVADLTGHGLPAAIGALPLARIFYDHVQYGYAVSQIARSLNRELGHFLPDDMFAAATIAELSPQGDRLTLWVGGMPEAILTDNAGRLRTTFSSSHMPLGILEDDEFESDSVVCTPCPGDRLYLYTDGIPEALDRSGQLYGEKRLYEHFRGEGSDSFQTLIDDLTDFGEGSQADDITLLELTCAAIDRPETKPKTTTEPGIPWRWHTSLDHFELQAETSIVSQLMAGLQGWPGLKSHLDYVHTILSELFSNALEHGILRLNSSHKNDENGYIEYYRERESRLRELKSGQIDIQMSYRPGAANGMLTIAVKDSGSGFDWKSVAEQVNTEQAYGRGMDLIHSLCQSVEYTDNGSRVIVEYSLD